MHNEGLSIPTIAEILSIELDAKINPSTLKSWIYRHIKKTQKRGDNVKAHEAKEESKEESETSLDDLTKKFDIFKK